MSVWLSEEMLSSGDRPYESCKHDKMDETSHQPRFDERSTTAGSNTELWDADDDGVHELNGSWSPHELECTDIEEEEGAREEAEFSLDGRLANMKRWRRFKALRGETVSGSEVQTDQISAPAPSRSLGSIFGPQGALKLPPPPGLCGASDTEADTQSAPQVSTPQELDFKLLNIDGSLLLQTQMPELVEQIRVLSQQALGVDTWEALLNPEPGDPEWQLLALVGPGFLAGFSKYAFFQEDCNDGSEGTIMSIHHVVVDEALRGMGHGRTMLVDLLNRAQAANAWAIKLYSTPAAVGFYERLGFQIIGPDRLMEKRLLD